MFKKTSTKTKNFSNYSKESKYYDVKNNWIVVEIKAEICSVPIKSLVGLKVKSKTLYFYSRCCKRKKEDVYKYNKAKHINKSVVYNNKHKE